MFSKTFVFVCSHYTRFNAVGDSHQYSNFTMFSNVWCKSTSKINIFLSLLWRLFIWDNNVEIVFAIEKKIFSHDQGHIIQISPRPDNTTEILLVEYENIISPPWFILKSPHIKV